VFGTGNEPQNNYCVNERSNDIARITRSVFLTHIGIDCTVSYLELQARL
jgi:hypothetical protein